MKDTLQLKIVQAWISIRDNSFLGKYRDTNMGEGALGIINCTKIWAISKSIAPRPFTYNCILLFLSNKPSFYIQPCVDWIMFSTIYLPFDILRILEFIQCLSAFFIRTSTILMRLKAFFLKVLITFLFFMKHSYLLTAKTFPNVNNSFAR